MDINKIIMESIQEVISENDKIEAVKEAGASALEKTKEYGKLINAKYYIPKDGSFIDKIKDHPYIAGGTAAALVAGLGAVALRKKIAAAMTKSSAPVKKSKVKK